MLLMFHYLITFLFSIATAGQSRSEPPNGRTEMQEREIYGCDASFLLHRDNLGLSALDGSSG
ncbi:MAG: hypothetical protein LUQ71_08075 [Methanoregula sp.]|nr:hypothetical protein [Methanoregula sp.]